MKNRNFGFTFGRTEEGQRRDYEELEKRLREQKISNPETPANKIPNPNISIPVSNSGSYWRIPVNYRNGIYTVDLAKSLLDNGTSKTQKDWAEYRKVAEPKGEFYTGDMPLYHSIFTSLFKQKDKPESEEARKFIQKEMRARWLMTLTRIAYQPKEKDKIIHNYGIKDKYELEENIVNPDRIIETADSKVLEAILGTGDVSEIKNVYNWINSTDTYIFRLNSKPDEIQERVAMFDASSDWAYLDCDGHPDDSFASLGVRLVVRPKGASPKK